jgi:hypothetical protein
MYFLYRHYDDQGNLLYVGMSLNAINRLSQHKAASHWYCDIARVDIERHESKGAVLLAENEAILNENPMHNLKRPTVREVKQAEKMVDDFVEQSRETLIKRVVQFNPMYSPSDVASLIGISIQNVKSLIEDNKIGAIVMRKCWNNRYNKEIVHHRVTGWQLISFLEDVQTNGWPGVE